MHPTDSSTPTIKTFSPTDYHNVRSDSHTHVHYKEEQGYFQGLANSICGIGIGFTIVLISFPLLFWNEGRAVQTARYLDEGVSIVTPLNTMIEHPVDSNNNKLIHLSGPLATQPSLSDTEFGISVHATCLKRKVELYQWVETKHKREYKEGTRTRVETTYSYHTAWKSEIVSSSSFSNPATHRNPTTFPISEYTKTAETVHVGSFQLSTGLKAAITNFKTLIPREKPVGWSILEQYLYKSVDPYQPVVGDVRISFAYAGLSQQSEMHDLGAADIVSIVARQNGNVLAPYKTESGGQLELLYIGSLTAQEIFEAEHTANTYLTWALRFAGWFLMFAGFQMIMDIFRQLVSFIPILRDVVGLATSLVALTFSSSLALLVVSVGWFWYRPLTSLALSTAAIAPLIISRQRARTNKTNKE